MLIAALMIGIPATAQAKAHGPVSRIDYSNPHAWLCKGNRANDVCGQADEDATIVHADGSTAIVRFKANPNAPIDCFYVYPTVSRDKSGNASMAIEPEEIEVVRQQFARFASVCRPYAPVYRQVTLTALLARLSGRPIPVDRGMAYQDVSDAWNYYLQHDNHGRGVVLIGHSQGSEWIIQLVKHEIDGEPVQKQIISVILGGGELHVPVGKDVGGDFKSIPLCRSKSQIGCAIQFDSFGATSPPPAKSGLFGEPEKGQEIACVNPATLGGGSGALHAYLAADGSTVIGPSPAPIQWTVPPTPITTPFVEVPSLLTAECKTAWRRGYLAVAVHPDPEGKRVNDITGDVIVDGHVEPQWGLHLIDMNLVMGNLIDIVRTKSKAYLGANRKRR